MKTIVCGRWNKHSSSRPEARALWSARNRFDANPDIWKGLFVAQDKLADYLVKELEALGVDYIGDGGFDLDSIFDVARRLTGTTGFHQLTRIPETNHFHRQWKIEGIIRSEGISQSSSLGRQPLGQSAKPRVACLPGPYSLARQTENANGVSMEYKLSRYTEALREEILSLLSNEDDVVIVRIEDPQILAHPEDWPLFQRFMSRLTKGLDRSSIALATWYGDVSALPGYFELPFGAFWLDFVEGKAGNLSALQNFPKHKQLIAGVFDARATYEEPDEDVAATVGEIMRFVSRDRLLLSTNTDLHFLPWDEALLKVERLTRFARKFDRDPISSGGTCTPTLPAEPTLCTSFQIPASSPPRVTGRILFAGAPYPTSTVGSFPQPQELRKARVALRRKEIDEAAYRALVEKHTRLWMDFQHDLRITVPVGGEFGREDMAAFYGIQFGGRLLDFVPSYENRRYRPVEYFESIRANPGVTVPDFEAVRLLSSHVVKETITGPATLADWALIRNPNYYHNRRAFRMDIASALRAEIKGLIAAGARIIQLDEPALTTKMRNYDMDSEAIYETIRDMQDEAYFILHICYSDMEALDAAFPRMLQLPFQQIHIEMANRNYSLLELIRKHGFGGKDIGLGVIDVHTDRIETIEEIVAGVRRVRKFFSPEQIWLTPDCGLKERSEDVARAKLEVMVRAAEFCRTNKV